MFRSLILAGAVVSLVPRVVGTWSRPAQPRTVTPAEIFPYMDGAGELYLAYRLARLEVYEYRSERETAILLELYWLESPDDAYGLLSGDWGGEAIRLDDSWPAQPARALYGAGLLRVWSDDLYVRILASDDTPAARTAVLELGRAVVAGRRAASPPELVRALPEALAGSYHLRADRVTFLRSSLVLNSIYFLATENLLDLGPETEAATATYERAGGSPPEGARLQVLVVRYPTDGAAREALAHFESGYLRRRPAVDDAQGEPGIEHVEDGWLGYERHGRELVLVFRAADAATATAVVGQLKTVR
jgi:hypothetical protein